MSDLFATKFNYYHHSPSAVQKPTEVDVFQKILRARGDKMYYGSPATVGRAVEDFVSAVLIDGHRTDIIFNSTSYGRRAAIEHLIAPRSKYLLKHIHFSRLLNCRGAMVIIVKLGRE